MNLSGGESGPVPNFNATFASGAATYHQHNILLSSEIAYRSASPMASLLGYYPTAGYQINQWTPYITYSQLITTNKDTLIAQKTELAEDEHTISIALNRYIGRHILVKGEYNYIVPGSSGYGLFYGQPDKNASMITFSINAVF